MQLKIAKEKFLELLISVTSVIERKHNIPILSNVRILVSKSEVLLTGSDLEVELHARATLNENECVSEGETTLSARKLLEICKSLPNNALINLKATKYRCTIKSGQSRFTVSARSAEDYPLLKKDNKHELNNRISIQINSVDLKRIFSKTAFCMAIQDVRFYLTGTLLEIDNNILRAVTTDGHRLAYSESFAEISSSNQMQIILPKKAVVEIQRIIQPNSKNIELHLGHEFLSAVFNMDTKNGEEYSIEFTTKLLDAKYPDYRRVLPNNNKKIVQLCKTEFREALQRVSILSNEKLRSVDLTISETEIELRTQDPDKNQAIEHVEATFNDQEEFEISFDPQYLMEILNQAQSEQIEIHLSTPHSSVLLIDPADSNSKYVVMPRRV